MIPLRYQAEKSIGSPRRLTQRDRWCSAQGVDLDVVGEALLGREIAYALACSGIVPQPVYLGLDSLDHLLPSVLRVLTQL